MKSYEITSVDSGKTKIMTESEAQKAFGRKEWKEIKKGYLPNLIVCECDQSKSDETGKEDEAGKEDETARSTKEGLCYVVKTYGRPNQTFATCNREDVLWWISSCPWSKIIVEAMNFRGETALPFKMCRDELLGEYARDETGEMVKDTGQIKPRHKVSDKTDFVVICGYCGRTVGIYEGRNPDGTKRKKLCLHDNERSVKCIGSGEPLF